MEKKQYIKPACKVVRYAPVLNNSFGDDTGLITVSGGEVDASLGESNQTQVWEDEEEAAHTSVWND